LKAQRARCGARKRGRSSNRDPDNVPIAADAGRIYLRALGAVKRGNGPAEKRDRAIEPKREING